MKKSIAMLLSLAMAASLTACGGGSKPAETPAPESTTTAAAADTSEEAKTEAAADGAEDPFAALGDFVMTIGHAQPEGNPRYVSMEKFAADVAEKTNGHVKVEVYGNGQLGTEKVMLEQVVAGTIQGMRGGQFDFSPRLLMFTLPFLTQNRAQITALMQSDLAKKVCTEAEAETGTVILSLCDAGGYRQFSNSKHPITKPEDLKGLKMRTNGMNTIVEEAGKKIGFFSLASIGNSAQTKELTAADLALAASEQVAALQAQGADAILCIAGPDTDISGMYADLADLGVTAVLDAGATANSTAKANGIAVVAAGSGWDSVGCLTLTFAADGSMTAEPASMSAADLKSARGSYTTAQQTAYDSAFTNLQSLADGDEDVRSQTLFTFEANESADKTISFANYTAALYLAYADGDRANCPQDAADLTVTALAGGITELDFGDVTRGALCDAVPAGQRLVLARTTSVAIGALIDTGTVTRTYEESLTAFEPTDGDALVVTDTATLEALEQAGGSYTILRDYGDVFWDIRMNINDVTNNFANPFTLPEAPQRGAGRK